MYTLVMLAIGAYYLWQSRRQMNPQARKRQQVLAWLIIIGSLVVLVIGYLPSR